MKTLLTIAACLMMGAAANAADVADDTLALLGVDSMTVVSDADGLEIRGQGGKRGGDKGRGGKGGHDNGGYDNGGKGGHGKGGHGKGGHGKGGKDSTPIIFQKETVKFVDFAFAHQKQQFSSEAKAVQFSFGKSEKITFIKGFGL